MEIFLLFLVVMIGFFAWQYTQYKRDLIIKDAIKDFATRIVPCKIEVHEGQYFIYEELTKRFLCQGKTPEEIQDNLPKDDRFYLSMDGRREIVEELKELECTPLKFG